MAATDETARWARRRRRRRIRFAAYGLIIGSLLTWRFYRPVRNRLLSDERRFAVLREEALAETNDRRRRRLLNEMIRDFSRVRDARAGEWTTWAMLQMARDANYGEGTPSRRSRASFFPPPPPEPEMPVSGELRAIGAVADAVERDRLLDEFVARYEEDDRPEAACWVLAALVRKAAGAVVGRIGELAQNRVAAESRKCGLYGERALCWVMESRYENVPGTETTLARMDDFLAAFRGNGDPFIRDKVVVALLKKARMTMAQPAALALYSEALATIRGNGNRAENQRSRAVLGAADALEWPPAKEFLLDLIIRTYSGSKNPAVGRQVFDAWLGKAELAAERAERIRIYDFLLAGHAGADAPGMRQRMHRVRMMRKYELDTADQSSRLRFRGKSR